jgi:hypothetical protein
MFNHPEQPGDKRHPGCFDCSCGFAFLFLEEKQAAPGGPNNAKVVRDGHNETPRSQILELAMDCPGCKERRFIRFAGGDKSGVWPA